MQFMYHECLRVFEPQDCQRPSTNLLLGFVFEGGTCGTTLYSIPYFLRSTADTASAAIDYSTGHIEDSVVYSPPSRGIFKTPACFISPLKRASPTSHNCFSPTPRTREGLSCKLILLLVEALEPKPLVAAVTSAPLLKDISSEVTE